MKRFFLIHSDNMIINKEPSIDSLFYAYSHEIFHDYYDMADIKGRISNEMRGLYAQHFLAMKLGLNLLPYPHESRGDVELNGVVYDVKITRLNIMYIPIHRIKNAKYDYILLVREHDDFYEILGCLPRETVLKFPVFNGFYKIYMQYIKKYLIKFPLK